MASRRGFRRNKSSVFRNILEQPYDESVKFKLYKSTKDSGDWVQRLGLLKILPVHSGCVNCICWNERGDALLSGSDDLHLVVTQPYTYKVLTNYKTSHKTNIFSAKFLPCTNDTGIVSCSGDGMILYTDLLRLGETHNNIFNCHIGTTYEVATLPNDPNTFLSCGEDYTVRSFDLRTKQKCVKARCLDICNEDVIISCQRAVTALSVNSAAPYQLAIGCSDSMVRLYDRRMLTLGGGELAKPVATYIAPGMEGRSYRITSLSFSPRGEDILVSYSSEQLYLFGVKDGETKLLRTETTADEIHSGDSPTSGDGSSPVAPVKRLRLRGDWSDTGPHARPQNYPVTVGGASQARPTLHGTLMQRMTDVLSRMLNDPATRAALSHGGEGAFPVSNQARQPSSPQQGGMEAEDEGSGGGEGGGGEDEEVDVEGTGEEEEARRGEGGSETEAAAEPLLDLPLPPFGSASSPEDQSQSEDMSRNEEVREGSPRPEEMPSTSRGPVIAGESPAPQSSNISNLSKELSHMYQGFVEKTGVEPMVNLTYSDVGPTASCISVFVKDDATKLSAANKEPERGDSSQSEETARTPSQEAQAPPHPEGELSGPASPSEEEEADSEEEDVDPLMVQCRILNHSSDEDSTHNDGPSECHCDSNTRKSYKQKYVGHRNARTMIKEATFWGDEYVISGSDCGHVFMWERGSGQLQMLLEADQHVVNCVQPHPYLPILATSGIDYDVKLWAPVHSEPVFRPDMADELMKRNAVMLEETKDTITVPASFMIRMLACLNQIRRGSIERKWGVLKSELIIRLKTMGLLQKTTSSD